MSRYQEYLDKQKQDLIKEQLDSEKKKVKDDKENKDYQKRLEVKEKKEKQKEKIQEFKGNLRGVLLNEALKRIYIKSIKNPSLSEQHICENLLAKFITDRGAFALLEGFKGKTDLLNNIYNLVNKHYKTIIESIDEESDEEPAADKEDLDKFYEELDATEDLDDVANTIRLRVSNAEEKFVQDVNRDKNNVETIMKDTLQRIEDGKPISDDDYGDGEIEGGDEEPSTDDEGSEDDGEIEADVEEPEADGEESDDEEPEEEPENDDESEDDGEESDDEEPEEEPEDNDDSEEDDEKEDSKEDEKEEDEEEPEEEVEESMKLSREDFKAVQHKIEYANRRRIGIFESMVKKTSKTILESQIIKEEFIVENGRIDMGKVIDCARCMYTLLEMVNTLKIEKVDSEYIKKAIDSI